MPELAQVLHNICCPKAGKKERPKKMEYIEQFWKQQTKWKHVASTEY